MTEVSIRTEPKGQRQISERKRRQQERLDRINAARPKGTVRVVPINDDIRRVLKHPNGMRFRKEGGIEWPNDSFTKRRIAEGVITLEEEKKPDEHRDKHKGRSRPDQDSNSAA